MDYVEAAMRMLGRPGSSQGARHVTNAHAVTGTAVGDSEGGTVLVDLGGDVTSGDGSQYVEVQTDANVLEGDTVDVLLVGESGHGMSPVVYGVPGGGDRMAAAVQDAHDLASSVEGIAQEAKEVAEATGQHFWPDDDGVHVTEVTQDEWSDSTSPNYHSGANVLINALGQLFRDGVNNILAIVSGSDPGVAIYDGEGNAADNIMALFSKALIRIGGHVDMAAGEQNSAKVQFFDNDRLRIDLSGNTYVSASEPLTRTTVDISAALLNEEDAPGTITFVSSGMNAVQSIYDDGTNYDVTAKSSIGAGGHYRYSSTSLGVECIEHWVSNVLNTITRRAYVIADTLRLTYGTGSQTTVYDHAMSGVARAITNADKANTWVTVSAANWATMNSGYSITASDLKYNAYQHRIIGSLTVRETTGHSAGNNVCGTVKSAYRPPARQIIHTTTNSAYKMFVDSGGGLTLVLGSATSGTTDHWFAADYIVDE